MTERATTSIPRRSLISGATDVAPVLLGIIPFGFVAAAVTVDAGYGIAEAIGFSTIVFAGAAQLAAIELLGIGAPIWVAVLTAVVMNLRLVMYSAAISVHLTDQSVARRSVGAYLLTDQAFALSVARFTQDARGEREPVDRWWYFLGTAIPSWIVWQSMTVLGAIVGGSVPDAVPLGFAVPLMFAGLLVPSITDRPTLVAALVGGAVAVAGTSLPANLGMPLGVVCGVLAGFALSRRTRR